MSKVTMPEPFGWLSDSLMNGGLAFSKTDPHTNSTFITNSTCAVYRDYQMTRYAEAVRRETLEKVQRILNGMYTEALKARVPEDDDDDGHNQGCLERALALTDALLQVRGLIESTPA